MMTNLNPSHHKSYFHGFLYVLFSKKQIKLGLAMAHYSWKTRLYHLCHAQVLSHCVLCSIKERASIEMMAREGITIKYLSHTTAHTWSEGRALGEAELELRLTFTKMCPSINVERDPPS